MKEKLCYRCRITQPWTHFPANKNTKDGRDTLCRSCKSAYYQKNREHIAARSRQWRLDNPERYKAATKAYCEKNKVKNKGYLLTWLYGLDIEDYNRMAEEQKGLCFICGNPPGRKSLCVDHNHDTGQVRRLLCGRCNTGLGSLRDSAALLRKAADYLDSFV